mmetsp:Transcript_75175/g.168336  ORF Transcript_75175/g.168336 Transcript_75175/m.168336 type:complete len:268 (-) Transcript_75175:6640-7443(-)
MVPFASTSTVGRKVPPVSKKRGCWPKWALTCSQNTRPAPPSLECRDSHDRSGIVASLLERAARCTSRRPASLTGSNFPASQCCQLARKRRWPMAHQSLYSRTCALKNMGCTPSANLLPSSASKFNGIVNSCCGGFGAGPRKSFAALAMSRAKFRSFSAVLGSMAAVGAPAAAAPPAAAPLLRGSTSTPTSELKRVTREARQVTASAAERRLLGASGTARSRMLSAVGGVMANSSSSCFFAVLRDVPAGKPCKRTLLTSCVAALPSFE